MHANHTGFDARDWKIPRKHRWSGVDFFLVLNRKQESNTAMNGKRKAISTSFSTDPMCSSSPTGPIGAEDGRQGRLINDGRFGKDLDRPALVFQRVGTRDMSEGVGRGRCSVVCLRRPDVGWRGWGDGRAHPLLAKAGGVLCLGVLRGRFFYLHDD
jgi:hypothetical protein